MSRLAILASTVVAFSLAPSSVRAQAQPQLSPTDALNAQLATFANQELDSPANNPNAQFYNISNATADDLVYAVFQVAQGAQGGGFVSGTQVANLAATALSSFNGQFRSDRNDIAGRIVAAALLGRRLTVASDIVKVVDAVATLQVQVNGVATPILTQTAQAATVGRALQYASGIGSGYGNALATEATSLVNASGNMQNISDTDRQNFAIYSLINVGSDAGQVKEFTDKYFDSFATPDRTSSTIRIAEVVLPYSPAAAAKVFGGGAADLGDDNKTLLLTQQAVIDSKLLSILAAVIKETSATVAGSKITFAGNLLKSGGANGPALPAGYLTPTIRGILAAGVSASAATNQVSGIVSATLAGRPLKREEVASFAAAAVLDTNIRAGAVIAAIDSLTLSNGANDFLVKESAALGALGTIGRSSPSSGALITQQVASEADFNTDQKKKDFAVFLATRSAANTVALGSGMKGIASQLTTVNATTLRDFTNTVLFSAPGTALNVAREVSTLLPASPTVYSTFASGVANDLTVRNTNFSVIGQDIAAGVAVTSVAGTTLTGDGRQVATGENAGTIAASVITANSALKARALAIAGSVAIAVDVERVADVAAKVGALYGTASGDLPVSEMGSLGRSMTVAINAKPLVGTQNRVDEIGEVAAELTRQAVNKLSSNVNTLTSAVASIASNIFTGLASSPTMNGGTLMADFKDATRDIAGSIAQTLSVMVKEGKLTSATVDGSGGTLGLISSNGILERAIAGYAGKYASFVLDAFSSVRSAVTGNPSTRLYVDPDSRRTEIVSNAASGGTITATGTFEIGSVIDNEETPFTNLP